MIDCASRSFLESGKTRVRARLFGRRGARQRIRGRAALGRIGAWAGHNLAVHQNDVFPAVHRGGDGGHANTLVSSRCVRRERPNSTIARAAAFRRRR
jgi:hypothetical protein